LPDYKPRLGQANNYGFDTREQMSRTYTGMGEDINLHDQWAVESQGPIQDRTREHLGQSDKGVVAYRKLLLSAIRQVTRGEKPPMALDAEAAAAIEGPGTMDGIGPAGEWESYWREVDGRRRKGAPWAS
jgi:hypothetical protein